MKRKLKLKAMLFVGTIIVVVMFVLDKLFPKKRTRGW